MTRLLKRASAIAKRRPLPSREPWRVVGMAGECSSKEGVASRVGWRAGLALGLGLGLGRASPFPDHEFVRVPAIVRKNTAGRR